MNTFLTVRVIRKDALAEGIAGFTLASDGCTPLPAFEPGAHIDVRTPCGAVRQYSLCNPGSPDGCYQIAVLRDPAGRGGSVSMHDDVHEGTLLRVSAPKNHFPLREDTAHALLFAGGIGITPLIAMASQLHARGARFALHYQTRSLVRTAFAHPLTHGALAARTTLYHDDIPAPRLEPKALLQQATPATHLYVCGPKGFMDTVICAARAESWDESRIHFEYFAAIATHTASDGGFEVLLARSGRTIRVASTQTVVQACEANGVVIPTSCLHGICGTCATRVLEGEVDHKDFYLTSEKRASHAQMLPCCSRAKTPRLVLDL